VIKGYGAEVIVREMIPKINKLIHGRSNLMVLSSLDSIKLDLIWYLGLGYGF